MGYAPTGHILNANISNKPGDQHLPEAEIPMGCKMRLTTFALSL
jgi:hypothetical protein